MFGESGKGCFDTILGNRAGDVKTGSIRGYVLLEVGLEVIEFDRRGSLRRSEGWCREGVLAPIDAAVERVGGLRGGVARPIT